jgi:TusA-related sulfurtransferase
MAGGKMKADRSLDCMGLYCPMPIVKTAEEMKILAPGKILEVIADDVGIKQDMKAWCDATGNELMGTIDSDGEIKVYVKKAA